MRQLSLLDTLVGAAGDVAPQVPDVPGLVYVPEYVSREEEAALLAAADGEAWRTEFDRRRQIHGLSYASATARPAPLGPLPPWVLPLAAKVVADGWLAEMPANLVVNEYLPGQGIGPHVDFPGFGPTVVAVSLGSACVLDLIEPATGRREALDVQPRSLWVLGGEARRTWQHAIARRKKDMVGGVARPRGRRVSITLRTHAPSPP